MSKLEISLEYVETPEVNYWDASCDTDGESGVSCTAPTAAEAIQNLLIELKPELSNAAPDQGNRTSELDDLLDHLVFRSGNGPNGSGGEIRYWKDGEDITAKAALKRLISQDAAKLAREVIGKSEPKVKSPMPGTQSPTTFATLQIARETRNNLRAEQRRRLDALQGGTKG